MKSTRSVSIQTRGRRGNISEPGTKIDQGIPFWENFCDSAHFTNLQSTKLVVVSVDSGCHKLLRKYLCFYGLKGRV